MAQNFGVSFVPDEQNLQQGKAGVGRGAMTPTQQAIKLLSLRLPRVVGGSPIAPAPLLQSQGSKGMPSPDSIASQVLKNVLPTDQTQRDGMAAPSVPRQQTYQPDTPPSPSSYSMPSLRPGELDGGMNAPPGAYTTSPQTPTPNVTPGVNPAPALPNVPTVPNRGPQPDPDVEGREIPPNTPLPSPDTTPTTVPETAPPYVPAQPQLSADMQDLLDRMRSKYGAPSYGEL